MSVIPNWGIPETHKGLKQVTRVHAREYSLLPYLETLVADTHFKQMAGSPAPCRCFKTRVLHFKVKNTPLKDKKWKEKV